MKVYKGKIKKKITVKLVGDAETSFQELNQIVGEQRTKGITSSKEITLLDAINKIFTIISTNQFYGENAKKHMIPREYQLKYGVGNLFIADLPDYWRMIYTLESERWRLLLSFWML